MSRLLRALLIPGLAIVTVVSCDDGVAGPIIGPQSRPLSDGTWYLNSLGDSALGTVVSARFVGAAEELAVLDSATLVIGQQGSFEQRFWIRFLVSGVLDRSDVVIDQGEWIQTALGYTFVSTIRSRTFEIRVPADNRLESRESFVFYANPPIVDGVYRRTRP